MRHYIEELKDFFKKGDMVLLVPAWHTRHLYRLCASCGKHLFYAQRLILFVCPVPDSYGVPSGLVADASV